ncbi:MAG TPA: threonine/serine exporter family protein [Vicinamibacteria bacterium]|nr:threonine/serine exporter family protein [Vicinamibacteria bacterium]
MSSRSMESLLARVARALHVRGDFQATPTQVLSIIWTDENRQRLHVTVPSAGNYDLTKLAQITELAGQVSSGAITARVGWDRLRALEGDVSRYPPWLDAVGFALCAVGFGVMLGPSWRDVFLGSALSLLAFGFNRLAADSQGLANALELVVATVVSALATWLCLVFPGSNPLGVTVCALIYFGPGFGLTLGANELMNGNTLSGLLGFTRAASVESANRR